MPTEGEQEGSPTKSPPRLTSPVKRVPIKNPDGPKDKDDVAGLITRIKESTVEEEGEIKEDDVFAEEVQQQTFLTEGLLTYQEELQVIDEVEFEDEGQLARNEYDELDEIDKASSRSDGSNVSSISEDESDKDYDTDLELEDPEKWLHPEKFDHDTTGIARYIRACEQMGLQPISYFIKNIQESELVMKYHGLGPHGIKAMSCPLEVNATIEKMDLEGNFILGEGTVHLTKMLKENVYLTELNLSENRMGNKGAEAICRMLAENKTLIELNLNGNEIEDAVAEDFYDMLSKNTVMKTLSLRHNRFEDNGAKWLADALSENVTLEKLDLSWNRFQSKGCVAIAEGLAENVGVKYLDLCMNGFGLDGAKALGESLPDNHSILELNISYCRIPLEGAPHIASALQNNDTLQKLNVGYNPVRGEGGLAILMGAEQNEFEQIKHLNFGNLMVKKPFKELADRLEEQEGFTILYGGVLLDVPRFRKAGYDPWSMHLNSPMTKLKKWLEREGYRLVDLLRTFDRDQSLTIDREELENGIKNAGIDLTDEEIDVLMQELDKDGSGDIDMSELMEGNLENTLLKREAERFKESQMKEEERRIKLKRAGDVAAFIAVISDSDGVTNVAP